jgi:hypothetical protein
MDLPVVIFAYDSIGETPSNFNKSKFVQSTDKNQLKFD